MPAAPARPPQGPLSTGIGHPALCRHGGTGGPPGEARDFEPARKTKQGLVSSWRARRVRVRRRGALETPPPSPGEADGGVFPPRTGPAFTGFKGLCSYKRPLHQTGSEEQGQRSWRGGGGHDRGAGRPGLSPGFRCAPARVAAWSLRPPPAGPCRPRPIRPGPYGSLRRPTSTPRCGAPAGWATSRPAPNPNGVGAQRPIATAPLSAMVRVQFSASVPSSFRWPARKYRRSRSAPRPVQNRS